MPKPLDFWKTDKLNFSPMAEKLPVVTCPGCRRPMALKVVEPSVLRGMQTVTFHCAQCDADYKARIMKLESNAESKA